MSRWIKVGRASDVPMLEGKSVLVDGRRVAIFRLPADFVAIDHACPHAGGPLADGIVSESCVTCPLHGWRIDLYTGEVAGNGASVDVHQVEERDGDLWLKLAWALQDAQAA